MAGQSMVSARQPSGAPPDAAQLRALMRLLVAGAGISDDGLPSGPGAACCAPAGTFAACLPQDVLLSLLREEWLSPLFFWRLGERAHPLRAACAADFSRAFERRARLDAAWREALGALDAAGVASLTLGSFAFADEVYPHPAAKLSQDVDLLVRPSDRERAAKTLAALGWRREAGFIYLTRDGLQLDLHHTPGDESRLPSLARAYGLGTEALFEGARPLPGFQCALVPAWEKTLDNRVIHFFKHYCGDLRHAVELGLLFARPCDTGELRRVIALSRSGKVWAFVLALLDRWDVGGPVGSGAPDLLAQADRAFAGRPDVVRVLDAAALRAAGRAPLLLTAKMLRGMDRLRYAFEVAWPPRRALLGMYARESAGIAGTLCLRLHRLGRAIAGGLKGR